MPSHQQPPPTRGVEALSSSGAGNGPDSAAQPNRGTVVGAGESTTAATTRERPRSFSTSTRSVPKTPPTTAAAAPAGAASAELSAAALASLSDAEVLGALEALALTKPQQRQRQHASSSSEQQALLLGGSVGHDQTSRHQQTMPAEAIRREYSSTHYLRQLNSNRIVVNNNGRGGVSSASSSRQPARGQRHQRGGVLPPGTSTGEATGMAGSEHLGESYAAVLQHDRRDVTQAALLARHLAGADTNRRFSLLASEGLGGNDEGGATTMTATCSGPPTPKSDLADVGSPREQRLLQKERQEARALLVDQLMAASFTGSMALDPDAMMSASLRLGGRRDSAMLLTQTSDASLGDLGYADTPAHLASTARRRASLAALIPAEQVESEGDNADQGDSPSHPRRRGFGHRPGDHRPGLTSPAMEHAEGNDDDAVSGRVSGSRPGNDPDAELTAIVSRSQQRGGMSVSTPPPPPPRPPADASSPASPPQQVRWQQHQQPASDGATDLSSNAGSPPRAATTVTAQTNSPRPTGSGSLPANSSSGALPATDSQAELSRSRTTDPRAPSRSTAVASPWVDPDEQLLKAIRDAPDFPNDNDGQGSELIIASRPPATESSAATTGSMDTAPPHVSGGHVSRGLVVDRQQQVVSPALSPTQRARAASTGGTTTAGSRSRLASTLHAGDSAAALGNEGGEQQQQQQQDFPAFVYRGGTAEGGAAGSGGKRVGGKDGGSCCVIM